jgi:competence protein ComEC
MQAEPAAKRAIDALTPVLRAVKERPLFPVAVYLCLGVASVEILPAMPSLGLIVLLGLLIFSSILFALKKDITLPIMLMAFAAGYALVSAALPAWASDPWAPEGTVAVTGRIASAGVTQSGYAVYAVEDVSVNGRAVGGRVLLTARKASGMGKAGNGISFETELARPSVSRFYGDFNARGYDMRQGVRFTAFASTLHITPSGQGETLPDLPARARMYATDVLNTYLSPESAALVNALLSGDKSGISADTKDAFIALGVAHLLAVSGLNISLTAGAAWLLCRKLRLPMPISWGVSFAVMVSYVLFAGLTASVLRAAVMWLVMMCGLLAARRYDPLSSISAAVIIILALNPLDLFDAGFQLSFAATAAMFLWLAPLMRHAPENKVLKYFAGAIGVTVCVTIFALPIILTYFNGISPISPLANLVLVPTSFVMQLAGTALLFVGFLPGVASLLGGILDKYAAFYLHNVSILTWSSSMLPAATPALWLSGTFALLVLLVSPSVASFKRGGRAAAFAALAVSAILMLSPLSGALTWHSEAAVVDEGKSSISLWWSDGGRNYAACGDNWQELAGYLKSRGISRLDGLYVLRPSAPKDGALLLQGDRIIVDRLYVPEDWLPDPAASTFLTQAVILGMKPTGAETGPVTFLKGQGKASALLLDIDGGRVAFVPWAPSSADEQMAGALAGVDVVIQAGQVAGKPYRAYNIADCGSIEIGKSGGGLSLTSWIGGWADGLQGNFR